MASPFDKDLRPNADFSLVLGGPLFQLLRRAHMSGDALELMRRRVVAGIAAGPCLPKPSAIISR